MKSTLLIALIPSSIFLCGCGVQDAGFSYSKAGGFKINIASQARYRGINPEVEDEPKAIQVVEDSGK